MRFCPSGAHLGSGATGTSTIGVNGTTPAALSGVTAGGQFGPCWLTPTKLLYQRQTGSSYSLQSYDVDSTATATVQASGSNFFAAGGTHWASWLSGAGVTSDVTFSGGPTLADAYVGDVSASGQVCLINSQQTGTGLTVFSSAGAVLQLLPNAALAISVVRLQSNILAYCDSNGWHLLNVTTGQIPTWYPRLDGVNWLIPVVMPDSSIWVVERTSILTIRRANSANAYTIESNPVSFNPDGIAFAAGVLRVGYCTNLGESPSALIRRDVTLATGASTIASGSGAFVAGPTFTLSSFPVGPAEGSDLTNTLYPPQQSDVVNKDNKITLPWYNYFLNTQNGLQKVSTAVQTIPTPPPAPAGFGVIAATGETPITATVPTDTLTLTDTDTSIGYAANPVSKTLDLRVVPQGPDEAIQSNDNGTLYGDANFTRNKTTRNVTITGTSNDSPFLIVSDNPTIDIGGFEQGISVGTNVVGGVEIATDATVRYLSSSSTTQAVGIAFNETPGSPTTYAQYTEVDITDRQAQVVGSDFTGAVPGRDIGATANRAGSGAASTVSFERLDGTPQFIWFDATGAPRYGPARPTEDGSVSDTSGTLFGAGGGGSSWIPLVDGSEPPNFITDGAGHLLLVAGP